ncbi:DUF4870 domain-containing protein [Brasilonema bromeliae]|uniref:DUF4870 domain-containing protein n=1 Tax=Brasilonema bromeliae SPC951 TaxID=385972 RepID=A0ABX1P9M7_9CYAN|nr:DUF4870 domain-containing protein [Brasilonema bromeliae]NMG21134.1 DUF4870 domain-containing protein [Brasilonema bromeliae SPC951]
MQQVNQRRLLSAICHGAIFFSSTIVSVGIPIAIMLTTKDSVVKANAKESLNFHINLYIYAIVFALLVLVAIGIPLLAVLTIVSFIMPILAILHILDDPNLPYRYPFIFRVL